MKKLLLIAGSLLICSSVWAAEGVSKEDILKEVKVGCLQSGNTEASCACSVKGFDEKISKEEWDLLTKPKQQISEKDVAAFQGVYVKMSKVAEECGATKE